MRLAWRALGLGLLAVTAACDGNGIEFCTNRNDAGECPEVPDFSFDASLDAALPSDASTRDGAASDAAVVADATAAMDASTDAGTDSATPPASYNVEDFCAAKYRVAKAWQDKFDECTCPGNTAEDRSAFLIGGLLYDDALATESVAACVTRLNAAIGPNLTFDGVAAVECASKFASQFTAPTSGCPEGGFQIDILEGSQGKQSQELTQLTECRAALVGKLALNAACTDSYQCKAGLRCLNSVCRDALASGTACGRTEQCSDGLVCVGPNGNRVCRPKNAPVALTSACLYSVECDPGAICGGTCSNATSRTICQ